MKESVQSKVEDILLVVFLVCMITIPIRKALHKAEGVVEGKTDYSGHVIVPTLYGYRENYVSEYSFTLARYEDGCRYVEVVSVDKADFDKYNFGSYYKE